MDHDVTRRDFLRCAGLAAASTLAAVAIPSAARNEERLNVLFITADDLGLQLGCYGETLIETPNIDTLAAGGVQFRTAYVAQASCSPSRSALFTGLHTHSTGQYGLTNSGFALHPELHNRTIPNLLKPAGYRTGIIGKLHVAPEESFQFDLREHNTINTRIDADPAYRISRQSRYDGTPVRRAFDTFANPPEFELYDLRNDPVEFNNLAGKDGYQAIQKRLTEALFEYRRQTDDPFLDPDFVEKIDRRGR